MYSPSAPDASHMMSKTKGSLPTSAKAKKKGKAPASLKQRVGPPTSKVQQTAVRSPPRITTSSSSKGDMRADVRHTEYIQDISGSVAYAVTSLAINPGMSATFPWLSSIATNYESYEFRSLSFLYRTLSGTTTAGKVILSVDFDAADSAPISKQAQLQARAKADDAAWENFVLSLDRADLAKFGPQRYIRNSTVTSTDIKTYDTGTLFVGTQSEANTNSIGELYVSYDVSLMTPTNAVPGQAYTEKVVSTPTTGATFFGTLAQTTSSGSITATPTPSSSTLTFGSPGQWYVEAYAIGTNVTVLTTSGTASNISVQESFSNGSTACWTGIVVDTSTSGQTLIITPTATTITSSVVRIFPWPEVLS